MPHSGSGEERSRKLQHDQSAASVQTEQPNLECWERTASLTSRSGLRACLHLVQCETGRWRSRTRTDETILWVEEHRGGWGPLGDKHRVVRQRQTLSVGAILRTRPMDTELSRAAGRVGAKTAVGCDLVPMPLVKVLGPKMKAAIADNFTSILSSSSIPRTWKTTSSIKLLYKGVEAKAEIGNNRPISIASVL